MRVFHMILAILVAVIWGGNFVATKYSVLSFPPLLNTAIRFAVVLILLLPFARFPKDQWRNLVKLAITLGTLHFALLAGSMWYELDIATCAIAIQMGVPFSALLSAYFLHDKLGWRRWSGLILCFIGVILVGGTPAALMHGTGFTLALAAAFFWAVTNVIMRTMPPLGVVTLLAWLAMFSLPWLLLLSYVLEGNPLPIMQAASTLSWMAVIYTALSSTLAGYGIWYYLLKLYPITMVAPFNLLTPVFGIIFGQIFFHQDLGWRFALGGVITLLGVAIIVLRRPRIVEIGEPH